MHDLFLVEVEMAKNGGTLLYCFILEERLGGGNSTATLVGIMIDTREKLKYLTISIGNQFTSSADSSAK